MALIHFFLVIEAALREERSEECSNLYGSRTAIYTVTVLGIFVSRDSGSNNASMGSAWLNYLRSLHEAIPALYKPHDPADLIIFIYLFMPILRDELESFVSTY
jgi:hypothetical protein